jgi:hypothetical protein
MEIIVGSYLMPHRLNYEFYVRYKFDDTVRAEHDEEAIREWGKTHNLDDANVTIVSKEWVKGGFKLTLEVDKPVKVDLSSQESERQ